MKLKIPLQNNHDKSKERECQNNSLTNVQKLKGAIFGTITLMFNVYASDVNHQENDKILIVNSVNKAFENLKIIFTRKIDTSLTDSQQQLDTESSKCSNAKCWYPSCISRYFQDYQRVNQSNSLCKIMSSKITTSEPRLFVAYRKRENRVSYTEQDLVDIANVLMKLKKYLKQRCQRHRLIATTKLCDKAVQCDYLQVSPEVRFFSRSSLVMNAADDSKPQQQQQQQQQQCRQNSSSLLEYSANYKPEFRNRNKTLRSSLSTSAIFGSSRDKNNYGKSPRKTRLKRVINSETIRRRTEDDILRYSNFIEADLNSFDYNNEKFRVKESTQVNKTDVLAVRKILLDDYITEVKEIIRSELSSSELADHETQILDSLRKRIDEDVMLPCKKTESYHTLSPSTSYVSARECLSNCCGYETPCDSKDSGMCLKFSESKQKMVESREKLRMSHLEDKTRYSKITNNDKIEDNSTSAKSSQSIDSGVQLDYPLRSSRTTTDWYNSSEDVSFNEYKTNKKPTNTSLSSSSSSESNSSSSDEMLCHRVESAVRKFTEKLIVSERRARDRSRSRTVNRQRHENPRGCTSLTDQTTTHKSFNCSKEIDDSSSEDECIDGISTPSLVSLTDEEIRG